jgi:hypothetical protein
VVGGNCVLLACREDSYERSLRAMETTRAFPRSLLKEIFLRPGVLTVSILYFFLQLAFNLVSWTVSPKDQAKYQLVQLVTWRVWMAVTPLLTLLLIVLIVRAAGQAIGRRDDQITEIRKLLDDRERRKKIREKLGKFLEERDAFSCFPGVSLSQDDHKALKQLELEISAFLGEELDYSFVARFKVNPLSALKDFIKELTDKTEPQI